MEKGFTITYEYGDNLYVKTENVCLDWSESSWKKDLPSPMNTGTTCM